MKFSSRETILSWVTMALLLTVATYFLGRTPVEEWRKIKEERVRLTDEIAANERLVDQRKSWDQRFELSMAQLNVYPEGLEVTPKLLEAVEQVASGNNLKLTSMRPDRESNLGDVYEVAIKCNWQGDLEATVRFLYALQSQGAMYKLRNLTVTPTGKSNQLKGLFTLDCAYARAEAPSGESTLQVVPVESNE